MFRNLNQSESKNSYLRCCNDFKLESGSKSPNSVMLLLERTSDSKLGRHSCKSSPILLQARESSKMNEYGIVFGHKMCC